MVLRDPPGLLSHTSHQNMHATLRLESETDQTHHGFDSDVEVGAVFLACAKAFQADPDTFLETGGGADFLTSHLEEKTTWSHQTSDNQWNPGSAADAFVVPNLNVKHVEALKIGWNAPTCSATDQTVFMFDLENQANKP